MYLSPLQVIINSHFIFFFVKKEKKKTIYRYKYFSYSNLTREFIWSAIFKNEIFHLSILTIGQTNLVYFVSEVDIQIFFLLISILIIQTDLVRGFYLTNILCSSLTIFTCDIKIMMASTIKFFLN